MKFNKWTVGLAAVGVVSLASAAKAEEKMSRLETALSSTTISGYVDTSIQWNPRTGNASGAPVSFQGPDKSDGFNLNVVQLSIAQPLDEAEWASGYKVDLWFGPDANALGSQSIGASAGDLAIRQAYVALRTPVGNGIDWKVGVFDTVIGYESVESGNNPNYTRSYGFTLEPTTHTGVLATYRLNDYVAFAGGVANTFGASINERAQGPNSSGATKSESYKTYMGSIALTAPDDWGWAAGSTLYAGVVNGFNNSAADNQTSYYVGATIATPVTGLKLGGSFDFVDLHNQPGNADSAWSAAAYASFQATEKLSFHGRGEYLNLEAGGDIELFALTGTVQYDLWANVISRLEVRWDRCMDAPGSKKIFGGKNVPVDEDGESVSPQDGDDWVGWGSTDPKKRDAFLVALQLIYKF
ncbi:MAG: outer membrane beta-barrel protein [Verrucomicrobiae bacterium]|nr:outer membrane beta-barrel protein [Verrucomicrobiae bacterium]